MRCFDITSYNIAAEHAVFQAYKRPNIKILFCIQNMSVMTIVSDMIKLNTTCLVMPCDIRKNNTSFSFVNNSDIELFTISSIRETERLRGRRFDMVFNMCDDIDVETYQTLSISLSRNINNPMYNVCDGRR